MLIAGAFFLNAVLSFALGLVVAYFLGPAEFGRYGIAIAAGVMLNAVLFEWVRLSATRFYSQTTREHDPAIRATLDLLLMGSIGLVMLGTGLALAGSAGLVHGWPTGIPTGFIVAVALTALAMGTFDYASALLRARFLDRSYAKLVIAKNALVMAAAIAIAAYTVSATATAAISALGAILAVGLVARGLYDPGTAPRLARRPLARRFAAYGMPIVAGNALLLAIPLLNRSFAAGTHGLAEAGFLTLAGDIGARIVTALGSALDVWLFQVAVQVQEREGEAAGRERIARNAALMLAILAPAMVGYALVLPAFEAALVPASFHGAFSAYSLALLPGFLALGIAQYALNPAFQLERRTAPITLAAMAGVAVDLICIWLLPARMGAIGYAWAQSAGLVAMAVVLIAAAGGRIGLVRLAGDAVRVGLAVAVMAGVVWLLRGVMALGPVADLIVLAVAGGAAYAAAAFALDAGGARGLIRDWRRARVTTA